MQVKKLPVTVLSGFLGAGKTKIGAMEKFLKTRLAIINAPQR